MKRLIMKLSVLFPEGVSTNAFDSQEFITVIDAKGDIYLVGGIADLMQYHKAGVAVNEIAKPYPRDSSIPATQSPTGSGATASSWSRKRTNSDPVGRVSRAGRTSFFPLARRGRFW